MAGAAATLSEGGALASAIEGFTPRAVQQEMAAAIEATIADGGELVVEAGTGTGKTFAYLVPAIQSGQRVIISTGTKALQDQLFHRDLPRVHRALGVPVKTALLKGRANYVCWYRLDKAKREGQFPTRAMVAELNVVLNFAAATRSGDLGECEGLSEDALILPRVTSTTDNCLGSECAFFNDCFVVKARRAAQEADLVVVNHHLLFADLAIRREGFGEILPGANLFVVDEAHQLPDLAGQFFGESLGTRQLVDLAQDALREAGDVAGARASLVRIAPAIEDQVKKLRLALYGEAARGSWPPLRDKTAVRDAIDLVAAALDELTAALDLLAEGSEGLAACAERAGVFVQQLSLWRDPEPQGHVLWYETSEKHLTVTATPLDASQPLREFRERLKAAWVFTSATLTVAGKFGHYLAQMGLEQPRTLALPSPFDYAHQGLMYLPKGLPAPNSPEHTAALVKLAMPVLEASDGRAFLLFTTHRALKQAAELLAHSRFPLFVQGTAPRSTLLEGFRASGNGVLLGAASFWEGVDVRGDALSVVVIDKLPFAPPDDPVLDARIRSVREQGGNPFAQLQIPQAAIALKQGAGRLIRDIHDRGVLMFGDPRLVTQGYGRTFIDSLPPMPRTRELADVQAFFAPAEDP
jgi:ATP-dependent DNA helicase DinG